MALVEVLGLGWKTQKGIALGEAPGPTLGKAEGMLLGQVPTDELLIAAGAKTAEVMIGVTGRRWSTEYKEVAIQGMAEQTLRRVLR